MTLTTTKEHEILSECGTYYFDEAAAIKGIKFFETEIQHVKGELEGETLVLEDWQVEIIAEAFGWKSVKTGYRKYRVIWIEIPKKNGKSFLAAGFGLYLTYADGEPGAEVICAAADKEQASHVFKPAKENCRRNSKLKKRSTVYTQAILDNKSNSYYKIISAEAFRKHGYDIHGLVVDEVHSQPNRELIETLSAGTVSRRQPLEIYLTTAGFDRDSICYEMHEYACKVRDGIIEDPAFLPVIYAADEKKLEKDPLYWTTEEAWKEANPNYGISVQPEYFERKCKEAQENPRLENMFKRLHLNIWTEQDSRWFPMVKWRNCQQKFTPKELEGRECFAGLDLSSTTDFTSLVLVFPDKDYQNYHVLPYFWFPKENISERVRQQKTKVPLREWVKDEYIFATEGDVIDYDFIRKKIGELGEVYNIREIALDRWNATQLATQLDGDGFEMVPFGQGFASMSSPSKEFEAVLYSKRLIHNGHPVLRWMASNVATEEDAAGNIKPSKKKAKEKIDGIVSLIMGLGRAGVHKPKKPSVYKERGLLEL